MSATNGMKVGEVEMKENDKKHLLNTFDDIIELMATQGQKIVCGRLQEIRKLLKEKDAEIEQLNGYVNGFSKNAVPVVRCKDCVYGMVFKNVHGEQKIDCMSPGHNGTYVEAHKLNWFCADGRKRDDT